MNCWSPYGLRVPHGYGRLINSMRVLISGGFGFVGGRLAQYLHRMGHQVVLGSRTVRSSPAWLREAEVVEMDWNDHDGLAGICRGVDVVIHAAGMNAQDSFSDPAKALAFNGVATALLLSAAIRQQVKRFIYLSTAHVYGSPLQGTITEETCPRNPHPYATSHLAGELAILYATQCRQIDGIVLRLSNVFGAPTHAEVNCWMLLANDLCRQAVETAQMVLNTTGKQLRDFVPMKSVCEIFSNLMIRDEPWNINSAINVGSGSAMSVRSMAELIQQRCLNVIDFQPKIHGRILGDEDTSMNLEFRTTKLAEMVAAPSIDMECEIDDLLRFCLIAFEKRISHF